MSGERPTASWAVLERESPDLASAGRTLLEHDSEVAIGFLATVSAAGAPHLAPVCPIFCGDHLYLSVGGHTIKHRDLDATGRYVLHAFLGAQDAEFQLAGRAERIDGEAQRRQVQAAIRFGAFGRDDPIFRLWIERCLHVYWERPGEPGTRPVRRRWRPRANC